MSEENMVSDKIDVLIFEKEEMEYREFIDKIEDFHNKNAHKAYEKFKVGLVLSKQLKGWTLFFNGSRPETATETTKREAEEFARGFSWRSKRPATRTKGSSRARSRSSGEAARAPTRQL